LIVQNEETENRPKWDEGEVAPGRFELPSLPPEGGMIDRYTTGLWNVGKKFKVFNLLLPA
jgi:hypothetical protein